jgi:hypothetical protein
MDIQDGQDNENTKEKVYFFVMFILVNFGDFQQSIPSKIPFAVNGQRYFH